jgi:hypothetical protein
MALSREELLHLEDEILAELPERLGIALIKANRCDRLPELLSMLEMSDLLETENRLDTERNGKIVVIGASEIDKNTLSAIVKNLGLDKDRFEFCLDYESAKRYDYRKLDYGYKYRVVLFGPVPHSNTGTEDGSSVVANMEKHRERFPRVVRLMSGNEFKITKTSFRDTLKSLIEEEYI